MALGSRGIAIVANDKVKHWLLPFLESWQRTNAHLPVFLIPYDGNTSQTRRISDAYGVAFAEIDESALDPLAKKLHPFGLSKRNRLRKFLSLALPLDEVIYFDVDILIFRDLTPALGRLEPGVTDFIVIAETVDYVYNDAVRGLDNLRDATRFNDGFFITSRKILPIEDFHLAIAEDRTTFDRVRWRGGLYTQPLANFVVHRKHLKIRTIADLVPGMSPQSYHKAEGVSFRADGPYDEWGRPICFVHWPGVRRPGRLAFDATWRAYAQAAADRMKAAGIDV